MVAAPPPHLHVLGSALPPADSQVTQHHYERLPCRAIGISKCNAQSPMRLVRARALGPEEADAVGLHDGTGQLAAEPRAGIQPDAIVAYDRHRRRRVAMHHDDAEILLARQERLADSQQIVVRLPVRRDAGTNAGVAEQIAALAMGPRQAA